MCEANAYLLENNDRNTENQTMIMEAVDKVEPEDNGIRLVSIFGDQKFIKGYIHSLSLVEHKVFIKLNDKQGK